MRISLSKCIRHNRFRMSWLERKTDTLLFVAMHKFFFFSNNLNWIVIDEMFNGWPCYLVQVVPNSLRWLKSFWSNFKFVIRINPLAQTSIAQIYITLFPQQKRNILNISTAAQHSTAVSNTYELQRDLYMFNTTLIDLSVLQWQLLIIRIVGIISITTMIKAEGNIYLMNIQH